MYTVTHRLPAINSISATLQTPGGSDRTPDPPPPRQQKINVPNVRRGTEWKGEGVGIDLGHICQIHLAGRCVKTGIMVPGVRRLKMNDPKSFSSAWWLSVITCPSGRLPLPDNGSHLHFCHIYIYIYIYIKGVVKTVPLTPSLWKAERNWDVFNFPRWLVNKPVRCSAVSGVGGAGERWMCLCDF